MKIDHFNTAYPRRLNADHYRQCAYRFSDKVQNELRQFGFII
jgi:predicted solute-binding protein